jgi:hypothetical protein
MLLSRSVTRRECFFIFLIVRIYSFTNDWLPIGLLGSGRSLAGVSQ